MTDYHYTDRDGDPIKVEHSMDRDDEGVAYVFAPRGAYVPASEAPALALAILETAGAIPADGVRVSGVPYYLRLAARSLKRAAHHAAKLKAAEEEAAARKADEEKLDAEAWALYKAHWGMTGAVPDYFVVATPGQAQERERWRKVARAARAANALGPDAAAALVENDIQQSYS